jgi:AraC-like DNA-binding protein
MYRFTASEKKRLQDLKLFIDEHLHLNLQLTSLCKKVGMNKHKLNRGFLELFGASTMAYVQQRRMQSADHLLKTTDKTIKEITGSTGYKYTTNFLIAYKKYFGHTAGSVRKQP